MKVSTYSRLALFVVYFWFGMLKVIGMSAATPLVEKLFTRTVPFMPFSTFLIVFGLFEVLIGILFLFRKTTKIAKVLFAIHMVATFLPLVLVPAASWTAFLVPTLEGQYIIKNIALIGLVIGL
jgi:uncharacterized membrane protein